MSAFEALSLSDMAAARSRGRNRLIAAVVALAVVSLVIVAELAWIAHPKAASRLAAGCRSAAPHLSVLMIGNSYTAQNDLPSMLATLVCKSSIATNIHVDELTTGGGSMHEWVRVGATKLLAGHDVVVLQEQSQTPGFDVNTAEYQASLAAVNDLAAAATAAHVHVVLFQTWAHQAGDPMNPGVYPTYDAMQTRIIQGYGRYLASIRTGPAPDADVAPVGQAWAWASIHNPSLFATLYDTDGSHPSTAGTYLAALVLARTISGHDLPAHLWHPRELSDIQVSALQAAARAL